MQLNLDEVVDEYAAAHKHANVSSTVNAAQAKVTVADIITKLRAHGITLSSILAVLGPIVSMVFAGTPAGAVINSILALLQGTAAGS